MAAMLAAATWATAVAQVAVGWLVVLIAVAATKAECKAVPKAKLLAQAALSQMEIL